MLPFPTLIQIDRDADTAVYLQIANQLGSLIRDGLIQPGARLPGSRELALLLRVHRKTVVAAFEELDAQDWIEAIPRKGIFVSRRLPGLKPRSLRTDGKTTGFAGPCGFPFLHKISLPELSLSPQGYRIIINDGFPDSRLAPMDLLLHAYKGLLTERNYKKFIPQTSFAGTPLLREVLTQFLKDTRGLAIQPSNILITRGAQMAIYLATQLILNKGDYVIVSRPNYFVADKTFEQAGARLLHVPADDQGIDVEAVEALCKKKKISLLYIIPHHHHPTTVTLSMDRRMKLLDIIRRYKLAVIEDDYDYDFHYTSSPILPLASAGQGGNIVYIGSLSKSLNPSIRLGYMIATPDFIRQATHMRRIIDIRGDSLMEDAMATLIRNGDMARHLKKSNKLYEARRDYCCDLLTRSLGDRIQFRKPDGGLAIWARFDARYPLPLLASRAAALGLLMNDGSYYDDRQTNYNALRIGFASMAAKEMEQVAEIFTKICTP
jgi:GntR family transcriptional regulator / MocR family aminotransferase